jgi:hypothetical protein
MVCRQTVSNPGVGGPKRQIGPEKPNSQIVAIGGMGRLPIPSLKPFPEFWNALGRSGKGFRLQLLAHWQSPAR